MMKRRFCLSLAFAALAASPLVHAADPIKIGFLVKQAEEPWFQDEWRFAEMAARDKGFTLVKIAVPSAEKTLAAIDNLAAQQASGFVICAPDVQLGAAIERAARRDKLKFMSVDDRLLDGRGQPIADIPHMGISAYEIGKQVGQGLVDEIKARGWKIGEVGALRIAYDQLPTARERTQGAVDVLTAAGLKPEQIVTAPQARTDTESAFNAANIAFTKNPRFKHWVAFGLNDEAVLGAVRAGEGRGLDAKSLVGIGIGGSKAALSEFAKPGPTGFHGTVLISPKRHGYETATLVYEWVTAHTPPPALTLTSGALMTRTNQAEVRQKMGL